MVEKLVQKQAFGAPGSAGSRPSAATTTGPGPAGADFMCQQGALYHIEATIDYTFLDPLGGWEGGRVRV